MSAPQAAYPRLSIAGLSLGVLVLLSFFSYLDRAIINLMVPQIRGDLGISDFQISLLQGPAFALFFATCGLPLGWAADRFSRRWVAYLGVTFWSLAATSCGLAGSFLHLLLGRFGVGAGEAALGPAAYSILADLFPKERLALATSVFSLGALLGSAAALVLGSWLIAVIPHSHVLPILGELQPWQLIFIITGAPGLLAAFLIFAAPETKRRHVAGEVTRGEFGRFLRSRRRFLICHAVGFGAVTLMAYALQSWMPTYLVRVRGWRIEDVGLTLALTTAIPGFLTLMASGWLVDRMMARGSKDAHFRYYLTIALAMTVLGPLTFAVASDTLFVILLAAITGLLIMAGLGPSSLQVATPPTVRGKVSGLYLFTIALTGNTLGPMVPAAFTDFLFHDEAKVGWSIALTFMLAGPIGAIAFGLGRAPMRAAVAAAETR